MMWTLHDGIGFVFFSGLCVQMGFTLQGRFTKIPANMTAKVGQNIEMECAFQSETASVYLEIQWWFIRAPEEPSSSEEETATEMDITPEIDPDDEGTKISTVKVQGNDISHQLQRFRVDKSDEGMYECRVIDANYGELREYKVQGYLKINATARPRPPNKTSPLHLTDKKPRKSGSTTGQDSGMSADQRPSSSSSQMSSSKTIKHTPGSGTRIATRHGLAILLLTCGFVRGALL
ncbi:V-set and transmembrane domain-containing protein 2A [Clupea harengus]|uniref:V-set and transmembrane domain-containing protein 2A n=1 Tax=Clupea harengus TaxID=7950 RepID=A0A6P8GWH0_CLUHA|nr:V-set and transmembrane domain-containing protein 2A [Clupea harengus]